MVYQHSTCSTISYHILYTYLSLTHQVDRSLLLSERPKMELLLRNWRDISMRDSGLKSLWEDTHYRKEEKGLNFVENE